MRVSEQISTFLEMLRETPSMCRAAQEDETRSDRESKDILHWFENYGYYASDAEIVRVGRALSLVRRRRRQAKDARNVLYPVAEWVAKSENAQKSMERLLGDVRKAEKATENKHYMDRTDIMAQTLETPDEEE